MECPCGSNNSFENCCGPYLDGSKSAPTAEALMRSRYTAFVHANVEYIKKTSSAENQRDFDEEGTREWATQSKWKGLKIETKKAGKETDKTGVVEFTASYEQDGKSLEHHEVSTFRKNGRGEWVYVDGDAHVHQDGQGHHHHQPVATVVRDTPKIGRNDPCTCGSGKKYKKCCGAEAGA